MRIAIVGYGRMGKLIRSMIESSGDDEVTAVIDPVAGEGVTAGSVSEETLGHADAVIDFSSAQSVQDNIALYSAIGIPAVIGTTGWYDKLPAIRGRIDGKKARIIYSGNFSIGVQIFLHLVSEAGKLIDGIESYDVAVTEIHHREKADSPSGTALMAAERILGTVRRKKALQIGNPEGKIAKDHLSVSSSRIGSGPGMHTVMLDSPADTIEITHTARSREGFAEGAIRAARWVVKQEPGIYTMDDFVSDLIGGR